MRCNCIISAKPESESNAIAVANKHYLRYFHFRGFWFFIAWPRDESTDPIGFGDAMRTNSLPIFLARPLFSGQRQNLHISVEKGLVVGCVRDSSFLRTGNVLQERRTWRTISCEQKCAAIKASFFIQTELWHLWGEKELISKLPGKLPLMPKND